MTVESNYVIAIATLSDWLKRVAPEKQNQNFCLDSEYTLA